DHAPRPHYLQRPQDVKPRGLCLTGRRANGHRTPPRSPPTSRPGHGLSTIPPPVRLRFHRSLQAGFQQDSSRMRPGRAALAPAIGDRRIAAPSRAGRSLRAEVNAMRRLAVIVALGALLGMFAGVATAAPALARGPKWQFNAPPPGPVILPADFCGFQIGVSFPVDKEYFKVLKAADGSMTLLITGSLTLPNTTRSTGKTIPANISGRGDGDVLSGRFCPHEGAGTRRLCSRARRCAALRGAPGRPDRGTVDDIGRREREPNFVFAAGPRPGGCLRGAELRETRFLVPVSSQVPRSAGAGPHHPAPARPLAAAAAPARQGHPLRGGRPRKSTPTTPGSSPSVPLHSAAYA